MSESELAPEAVTTTTTTTTKSTPSRFALKLDEPEDRGEWSSRTAFYMATIGAAVGFGNVWRFPSLAAEYGGGAFFIPYLMALFLLGIPLAILEIGFGQFYRTGKYNIYDTQSVSDRFEQKIYVRLYSVAHSRTPSHQQTKVILGSSELFILD